MSHFLLHITFVLRLVWLKAQYMSKRVAFHHLSKLSPE